MTGCYRVPSHRAPPLSRDDFGGHRRRPTATGADGASQTLSAAAQSRDVRRLIQADCWKNRLLEHPFTKLQGQYLAFIVAYVKLNRRPPAEADFQRYFDVTPPSVHNMILTLERHGLITRTPGRSRSVEVLVPRSEVPPLD